MKFYFLFFLLLFSKALLAQNVTVQGFVIDKESKARLARVFIYSAGKDEGFFNNLKGEFSTTAKIGDTLFAALSGYAMDTAIVNGRGAIVFQLKSLAITLKEVEIIGKRTTPQERYEKNMREYRYALSRGSTKDLFSLGSGGAGLSIDAVYNLLSRQGKNARYLQSILEKDYRDAIIDYRFNSEYVKAVLKEPTLDLKDFMQQYRPTYLFVLTASDYAFVQFIKNSYNSYNRNPAALRLPALPKFTPEFPLGN